MIRMPAKYLKMPRRVKPKPWVEVSASRVGNVVTLMVPAEVVSELNQGGPLIKKLRRKRDQKQTVMLTVYRFDGVKPSLPCTVTMTRLYTARGKPMADDALPGSLKVIRDSVADWIIPGLPPGRADDDPRITWRVQQERGAVVGVKVEIVS